MKNVPAGDGFCGLVPSQCPRTHKSGGICVTKIRLGLNNFNSHFVYLESFLNGQSCWLGLKWACSAIVREALYGTQPKLSEITLTYSTAFL